MIRLLPILLFTLLIIILTLSLVDKRPITNVETEPQKIGNFTLPTLEGGTLNPSDWKGRIVVVNAFASWCVPCVIEHPRLVELSQNPDVLLYGIGWKDNHEAIKRWLEKHGNPFAAVGVDGKGESTVALGLSGVPETWVIDANGTIILHYKSPLTSSSVEEITSLLRTHTPSSSPVVAEENTIDTSTERLHFTPNDPRAQKLFRQFRCVVCQGEPLAESQADVAKDMRVHIIMRLNQGLSDEAITNELVTRYGGHILLSPPLEKTTWILWFAPFFLVLLGGGFVLRLMRRKASQ